MDRKSKLENLINLKKEKGSNRKPKYASRKLSIGLVSFMLGFTLLVSPTDTFAAEQAGTEVSEVAEEAQPNEAQDQAQEEKDKKSSVKSTDQVDETKSDEAN
ncbi:MAG: YSIRK-type signal peptide-containing protein, partial [Finegoldia magna]|uniref:YSIRK-type signal peptide-containing protein n=1 Tax=Finegoldia magna TaxID=1260 RepID=UPI00290B98ED